MQQRVHTQMPMQFQLSMTFGYRQATSIGLVSDTCGDVAKPALG